MGGPWDTQNMDCKPGKSKWLAKGKPEEMTHKVIQTAMRVWLSDSLTGNPRLAPSYCKPRPPKINNQDQYHFEYHEWQAESTAPSSEAIVKVQGRKDASLELGGDRLSDE